MRKLKPASEPRKPIYSLYVHEVEGKEVKEEEYYCPQCGREFSKEFRYLENCVYCGQRLDWRKI